MVTLVPAPNPCRSCPYRKDVPSGVWAAEEYEKLPEYDRETAEQPISAFLCHQQDGRLCAGWVAVHDMENSLGLRLITSLSGTTQEEYDAIRDYSTSVALFESGAEAAEHGLRDLETPGERAQREIKKLYRKKRAG